MKSTRTETSALTVAPRLEMRPMAEGWVEVHFERSIADAIDLYSRVGTDCEFQFFARVTHSPFIDNRALKVQGLRELRCYKAIYIMDGEPLGTCSAESRIIAIP
jgi:hypothetical protein